MGPLMCVTVCLLSGILHGAGLWQFPKQLYLPTEEKSAQAPNSHLKYVWYDPELFPAPSLRLSGYVTCVPAFASLGLSSRSAVLPLIICCCLVYLGGFITHFPKKNLE